jgi:hypothetical protein
MTTIDQIKKELLDIIELEKQATTAPWHKECHDNSFENGYAVGDDKYLLIASRLEGKNASFIAASRNLTPKMAKALLTAIEALEAECPHGCLPHCPHERAMQSSLETIRREWEGQA